MTYSETPQLQPVVPSYRLRILSDGQLGQLKSATLDIPGDVGVHSGSTSSMGSLS
jgi:hypothetical protein